MERLRLAPYRTTLENMRKALHAWKFDRNDIRPAVAPTIPLHCDDEFLAGCGALARDYGVGLQTHLAESKVQVVAGMKRRRRTTTTPSEPSTSPAHDGHRKARGD